MVNDSASPFLLVGAVAGLEPAALRALQDARGLPVREVRCLYAAAACLGGGGVRMVLIEGSKLSVAAARGLEVFHRHARVPVVVLPSTKPVVGEVQEILRTTTLTWEAAVPLFPHILQTVLGLGGALGEEEAGAAVTELGNPVTLTAAGGYDAFHGQPLLSEDELQALLGPAEEPAKSA